MQNLYEATIEKVCYLKEQGFNIVEMWECDLKKELEENEEMRCYFEEYDLVDLLQPRDAFFGGRTNATKLFHQCEGEEKIRLKKIVCYYGVRMLSTLEKRNVCCYYGARMLRMRTSEN